MFDPLEIKSTALEEAVWQMPAAVVIVEAPSGRILLSNKRARETMQRNLGRSFASELEDFRRIRKAGDFQLFHLDGRVYEPEYWPLTRTSRTGEEIRDDEYFVVFSDGTRATMRCDCSPVYDTEGRIVAAVGVYHDVTRQKRAEEEIKTRTRQQAEVARLGMQALATDNLQSLLDEAVSLMARTLQVEYSEVVEVLPGGEELLLRAGEGWQEGLVGTATARAGSESQAGYALLVNEPVIVEDLGSETRFSPPAALREHGVVSGMSVPILGQAEPLGL
ncbi:MAG: GAF domain-containing protein, partial [Rubrobacter sp.]